MATINLPQSVATGIGPGVDGNELSKTRNTLIKVVKGQYTYNNNLVTSFDYLHDATCRPYSLRNEKWSFAKQKVAQWVYGDGTEKCLVKYTIDYQYGTMEMETFGRVDKYNVIKQIRVSNVTVQDLLNVNVDMYSQVTLAMEGRMELDITTTFEADPECALETGPSWGRRCGT
jgi:hypothetical protein